jgi:hypothetical protein
MVFNFYLYSMKSGQRINSFKSFYPYYLEEHKKSGTRILHFVGTSGFIVSIVIAVYSGNYWFLPGGIVLAYAFAWTGHFFIEKNKPATFQYPLWSLLSDFKLYFQIIIGKESFHSKNK